MKHSAVITRRIYVRKVLSDVRMVVYVDLDKIADTIGAKAAQNKSGSAIECGGAVVCEVLEVQQVLT